MAIEQADPDFKEQLNCDSAGVARGYAARGFQAFQTCGNF